MTIEDPNKKTWSGQNIIAGEERWGEFKRTLPGFSSLPFERAKELYQSHLSSVAHRRLPVHDLAKVESDFVILRLTNKGIVIFNKDIHRAIVLAASDTTKEETKKIALELIQATGWWDTDTARFSVQDSTPVDGSPFSLDSFARSIALDVLTEARRQKLGISGFMGASDFPLGDASARQRKGTGTQGDSRWQDYMDLLPGFSRLDHEDALAIFHHSKDIDYKQTRVLRQEDAEDDLASYGHSPKVGFVELDLGATQGSILLSKELKLAFLYPRDIGATNKLHAVAEKLLAAANWGDPARVSWAIETRDALKSDEGIPLKALAEELGVEHDIARRKVYNDFDTSQARPMFVSEFATFVEERGLEHQEKTIRAAREGRFADRDKELLCGRYCKAMVIFGATDKLMEKGLRKITLALPKNDYVSAYAKFSETLIANGIEPEIIEQDNIAIESPKQANTKPEGGQEDVLTTAQEHVVEPEKLPTNLDHALRHVRYQLKIQRELVQKHQDRLEDGSLQSLPNGHHAVFQKYLEVFKNLKFLKKNGIEWVGDEDGVSEEKLFSNIRKIRAEVEKNPSAIPPAGTLESYAYLQNIIDREDNSVASVPTNGSNPIELPTDQEPSVAPSEPPIQPEPQELVVELPKAPASTPSMSTPLVVPTSPEPPEPEPAHSEPKNPVPTAKQPPVKREWRRAKAIFRWARQNAPALVVGGLTGVGVRIAAQFSLAAFVTTTPGIAAAICSAMAIGAVAGGVSKLATTSIWGGEKKDDKHWKRKAFLQGAAMGAVGAGIGAGVAQWLISNDYLHGWFGNEGTPPSEVHGTVTPPDHTVPPPVDQGHVPSGGEAPPGQPVVPPNGSEGAPEHVAPTPEHTVTPPLSTSVPSHTATTPPVDTPAAHAQVPLGDGATLTDVPPSGTEHATPPAHSDAPPAKAPESPAHQPAPAQPPSALPQDTPSAPPADTTPPVVPQGNHRDILTEEQFEKLPRRVRSLASSTNPREIALFCKEASFNLINGSDRGPETLQAGAKLIEHGLEAAKAAKLDNTVTKMLHADLAYLKAWGIGTDKNVEAALTHARQAGTVMHNYGDRLLKLFGRLTNG